MEIRKAGTCFWGKAFFGVFMLVACGAMVSLTGCGESDSSETDAASADDQAERFQEEYFQYAMENLQRIQEFSGGEMRQQIVDRLNQWITTQQLPPDGKVDPMVEKLPVKVDLQQLSEKHFTMADGYSLQQAIWMRDLSKWTCGESNDPVERGGELFDWIVRNLLLRKTPADGLGKIPKQPWETLFFGRGTAVDLAWVFCLAARQQAIDAVILTVPSREDPEKRIPWAIGLMKGKELYLFDPALGLAIPAKDGVVREGTRLVVKPATLSQVLQDPAILEQLDVSESQRYPISIEQIQKAVAMIPASSSSLSAKFALIQSRMAGNQRTVLTAHPSTLAKELGQVNGLDPARVALWPRPFIVDDIRAKLGPEAEKELDRAMLPFLVGKGTPLWKGRAAHIMGNLIGEPGATWYYQKARPSNRQLMEFEMLFGPDAPDTNQENQQRLQAFYRAKHDASYWLGLVNYSLDDPEAAADYFMNRTLKTAISGPWHAGAVYNLARCLEQFGKFQRAAEWLRVDKASPMAYGNRLRAEWLAPQPKPEPAAEKPAKETEAPKTPPAAENQPEDKKPEATPAKASES